MFSRRKLLAFVAILLPAAAYGGTFADDPVTVDVKMTTPLLVTKGGVGIPTTALVPRGCGASKISDQITAKATNQ
jgi:hypothetical protein